MIASPITIKKSITTVRCGGLLPHGRLQHSSGRSLTLPAVDSPESDQRLMKIYLMTQERAWLTNQITLAISANGRLNLVPAVGFEPEADEIVEYIAWPPGWHYRRK